MNDRNPLIVALDRSSTSEAVELATVLGPKAGMLKVGFELFWAEGPDGVRAVARHGRVFVDSKLHDIPNTVEHAAANITRLGAAMFNVHALGGDAMMRAALKGAEKAADELREPRPIVIAVTVLSSHSGEELASAASLAYEAREAGLDGVVVSGDDVSLVREACGEDFLLVVPGIRPSGSPNGDQRRVLTPRAALEAGADWIVVGRPITEAPDPASAAEAILAEC